MAIAPANAGSRSGLITWSVISTIVAVACLVWAIISYSNASKSQRDYEQLVGKYGKLAPENLLNTAAVRNLDAAKTAEGRQGYNNLSLIEVANRRFEDLYKAFVGPGAADGAADIHAIARLRAYVEQARTALGGKDVPVAGAPAVAGTETPPEAGADVIVAHGELSPTGTALDAIAELIKKVQDQRHALEAATATNDQLKAQVTKTQQDLTATVASYSQQTLQPVQARADAAEQQLKTVSEEGTKQIGEMTAAQKNRELQLITDNKSLQDQITSLNAQLADAVRVRQALEKQLGRNSIDQILRNPDGHIIRVESTDRVVIDLGRGDGIPAGMTFEVYDAKLGIPAADSAPEADKQVKGKASIEVLQVNQGSSVCRVVRTDRGVGLTEGDLIANLIYDRNNHFNFVVFGKFNLDNRGEASERDAEIVKRLVSQWGGNVVDQIGTDTDFVVLGAEPVVPAYTSEERASDPIKETQFQQAQQELDRYNETRSKAQSLNIPLLNQKRFLYLIGYYEQSAR
ncbi:MAG: hypothetical protein QM770_09405 [Tepidisphaeraceae bacterium]